MTAPKSAAAAAEGVMVVARDILGGAGLPDVFEESEHMAALHVAERDLTTAVGVFEETRMHLLAGRFLVRRQ